MKIKSTVAALVLAVGASLALAQPPHGRGAMLEQLDLNDEQREQIAEIHASGGGREEIHAVLTPEQQAKAAQLRSEWKAERKGRKGHRMEYLRKELDLSDEQVEQMREIHEEGGSREDVRAVLTEDQQEQFDQMKKDRKGGKGGKHGKKPDSAPE